MLGQALASEIDEIIKAKQFDALKSALSELPASEIAEIIDELNTESAAIVFRTIPRQLAGEAFAALSLEKQEQLLTSLSNESVASILNGMPPDDRTALFEELPGEATQRLINLLTDDQRKVACTLLGYPEESIGRLMTPNYIAVRPDWTIEHALNHIRQSIKSAETSNVVYVIDEKLRLLDDLKLAQIVGAPPEQTVRDLMDENFVALRADDDQETAVAQFKKHYRVALPVTDSTGILVGIVTLDDMLTVAEEEATEDIQKIGGLEALEEPYVDTPFWTLIRKRGGWLLVLFIGEMLTTTVMAGFEEEIARAAVLAIFVPLIISSGGNSGSQAATLIIRALAVGELGLKDWWMIMKREFLSGFVLGSILGMVGFLRIIIWSQFSDTYGPHYLLLASAVMVTLVGVVLWGTLSGSMLPLILKKCRLDPAVSSAPFVATLVDVVGIAIYFEVAAALLRGTLL